MPLFFKSLKTILFHRGLVLSGRWHLWWIFLKRRYIKHGLYVGVARKVIYEGFLHHKLHLCQVLTLTWILLTGILQLYTESETKIGLFVNQSTESETGLGKFSSNYIESATKLKKLLEYWKWNLTKHFDN